MATPSPTSGNLAAVKALLDEIVVAKEQRVVSAVAALVAARMETKLWLALQVAVYNYAPVGPFFGSEEELRVWEPVRGAMGKLLAGEPLEKSAPVQQRFEELSRAWRCAATPSAGSRGREEPGGGSGASSGVALRGDATNHGDMASAESSTADRPAIAADKAEFIQPAPPRRGLRGALALETLRDAGVQGRQGVDTPCSTGQGDVTEGAAPLGVGSSAGHAAAGARVRGGTGAAEDDHRSTLAAAARSFGEAVVALDAMSVTRMKSLSEEFEGPGHADAILPTLTSISLAVEVGDALDTCSVELLKKWVALEDTHVAPSVSSTPAPVVPHTDGPHGDEDK